MAEPLFNSSAHSTPNAATCITDLSAAEKELLAIFRGLSAAEQQALLGALHGGAN